MPVLFGVFLYMGFSSLKGLQFFDRILIMFMPNKYQPDYMFLRQVFMFADKLMDNKRLFLVGSNQKSTPLHPDPTNLLDLFVADQVVQQHLDFVPVDVGGDDRHQKITGSDLHQARTEDSRRSDARDDQTPRNDAQRGPRGGHFC